MYRLLFISLLQSDYVHTVCPTHPRLQLHFHSRFMPYRHESLFSSAKARGYACFGPMFADNTPSCRLPLASAAGVEIGQ